MAAWHHGTVSPDREHIAISCGKVDDAVLVARVGRTEDPLAFVVEFLPGRESAAIEAVRGELDFYLVEKGEKDPWAYAVYHCSTAANLYGDVHWGHWPHGKPTT